MKTKLVAVKFAWW